MIPSVIMVNQCPRCGLCNLPTSQRCDCGYALVGAGIPVPPPDLSNGSWTHVPEVDALPAEAKDRIVKLTRSAQQLTWLSLAALWIPIVLLYTAFMAIRGIRDSARLLEQFPQIPGAERAARSRPRPWPWAPRNATLEAVRGFPQARRAFWILPFIPVLYMTVVVALIVHTVQSVIRRGGDLPPGTKSALVAEAEEGRRGAPGDGVEGWRDRIRSGRW